MRRCEDEKMRYRPPLLEEPCAQTLSGKRRGNTTYQTSTLQSVKDGGRAPVKVMTKTNVPIASCSKFQLLQTHLQKCRPAWAHGSPQMARTKHRDLSPSLLKSLLSALRPQRKSHHVVPMALGQDHPNHHRGGRHPAPRLDGSSRWKYAAAWLLLPLRKTAVLFRCHTKCCNEACGEKGELFLFPSNEGMSVGPALAPQRPL